MSQPSTGEKTTNVALGKTQSFVYFAIVQGGAMSVECVLLVFSRK